MIDPVRTIFFLTVIVVFLITTIYCIYIGIKSNYSEIIPVKKYTIWFGLLFASAICVVFMSTNAEIVLGKNFIEGFKTKTVMEYSDEGQAYEEDRAIFPKTTAGNIAKNAPTVLFWLAFLAFYSMLGLANAERKDKTDEVDYDSSAEENEKLWSELAKIILSLLFLFAMFELPYWYYNLFKFVSFILFLSFIRISIKRYEYILPIAYFICMIVFQPFTPFHFSKQIWMALDASVIIFLVGVLYYDLKIRNNVF